MIARDAFAESELSFRQRLGEDADAFGIDSGYYHDEDVTIPLLSLIILQILQ